MEPTRTETRQLNGQEIFIRHWSDESLPPLLMLHGFPEYGGAWADLAAQLFPHFHCIAPDQRGYGQSSAPEGIEPYAMAHLMADMAALIRDRPVTVLAHDWGASVGYALAMFRPELVARLIILNGVHPVPFQRAMAAGGAQSRASQYINALRAEGSAVRLAKDDFAGLLKLFSTHMDLSWLTTERLEDYRSEWGRPGRLRAMINWYRASPLQVAAPGKPLRDLPEFPVERLRVNCPHLLIWGVEDTALLPEATAGLETFAPDLTRIEVEGADHWLHHQKPSVVAQAILDWCGTRPL
ncbi:alpha/beta fold hydrolase [Sulfitobacter dubius]|uniref:alpha/beta fold hydrolase n=1 Tax=Sulfitobacter dubius TaxID=218673 RepID=UPI0008EB87DB|nr:alpha/beta hydrolase [Sulfitobacter dubius]SFG57587.1 Pimeloyl-ACP methyl ester carboxylesterase [Sulfitobacter dubius]